VTARDDRIVESLPPVVLRARWAHPDDASLATEVDRLDVGDEVALRATTHLVPAGETATFVVQDRRGRLVATIEANVDHDRVAATWAPRDAGVYSFEVLVAGADAARSTDLLVERRREPLKLVHIGRVLRTLLAESRVVARWYLEDLSFEHLCALAERGVSDPENDPAHMPRELCLLPGMAGDDVREAQRALAALGHGVPASGTFDEATRAAFLAWLPGVQGDRERSAAAVRTQVARDSTFAQLCSARGIAEWSDLWADHDPGREENPDLPWPRAFDIPAFAQRNRGHELLEATGRDTSGVYGGLSYVPPIESVSRSLIGDDGAALPASITVAEWSAVLLSPPIVEGARLVARLPRGARFDLVSTRPLLTGPTDWPAETCDDDV
jgi:hypothetical protein